ncbi:hypothetical protein MMC15_004152 [Xylographa vitiligo]|nr:hypothetical protein [Xylographa vitiligo]
MADCERTHDLPIGCNTLVYAFIDSNGSRALEMGSVSIPLGASRLKFHRPQKVTIQRAIPPPPSAPVQVTPEIMTAVTSPPKKKKPKNKKKMTRLDPPSNDRASLKPYPASYENTEYHHIEERKERHEIESRTNTSSKSYGSNDGRTREPRSTSSSSNKRTEASRSSETTIEFAINTDEESRSHCPLVR